LNFDIDIAVKESVFEAIELDDKNGKKEDEDDDQVRPRPCWELCGKFCGIVLGRAVRGP
jgi:hypothetical protein